jgi:hypothetical protein
MQCLSLNLTSHQLDELGEKRCCRHLGARHERVESEC